MCAKVGFEISDPALVLIAMSKRLFNTPEYAAKRSPPAVLTLGPHHERPRGKPHELRYTSARVKRLS